MKKWPKDETKIVAYEDLVNPIRKALEESYDFSPKNITQLKYKGYNTGPDFLIGNPPPDEQLQKDMIEYHKERGRDVLDIILNITFALGMEQGRRIEKKNSKHFELSAQFWKEIAENHIKN